MNKMATEQNDDLLNENILNTSGEGGDNENHVDQKGVALAVGNSDEEFDSKCCAQLSRISWSTWAVFMTEVCERFSYYGIKAVLILYLTQSLLMSHSEGKAHYHTFSMLSYFTGVAGAIMADSFFGKFKTIIGSLVIYSLAEMTLTLTSVPDIGRKNIAGPLVGLYVMGIACGNIKPCLGAFGGDQINQKDTRLVATFFSMFYMSVNVGAMLTMIFVPMIRTDIQCYGSDCYPVVFGVNCIIIIASLFFFMIGAKGYVKRKPAGNMLVRVSKMIYFALSEKLKSKGSNKEYWLYYADEKYSRSEINDVRGLLKVLVLYIPLPVFWALFHQQGSSWILQAEQMDGDLGSTTLRSDQIQFVNPVLVLILIPVFDGCIYPLLEKCNLKMSSLKKMVCGMILAAIAFFITGFIQIKIQNFQSAPSVPSSSYCFDFINVSPCQLLELHSGSNLSLSIPYGSHSSYQLGKYNPSLVTVKGVNCFSKNDSFVSDVRVSLDNGLYQSVFIDINTKDAFEATVLHQEFPELSLKKSFTRVRTIYTPHSNLSSHVTITYEHPIFQQRSVKFENTSYYNGTIELLQSDKYLVKVQDHMGNFYPVRMQKGAIKLGTFGEYTVTLKRPMHDRFSRELVAHSYADVKTPYIHRLWQLPQYIVLTAGEIMFSVTGLEFAYSQAPQSMKSVLQSFWMLTTAFGDLIVVILSVAKPVDGIEKEMFLYGGVMIAVAIIFAIMCHYYTYNDFSGRNVRVSNSDESEDGRENLVTNTECL